jgi:hypothetical protein
VPARRNSPGAHVGVACGMHGPSATRKKPSLQRTAHERGWSTRPGEAYVSSSGRGVVHAK